MFCWRRTPKSNLVCWRLESVGPLQSVPHRVPCSHKSSCTLSPLSGFRSECPVGQDSGPQEHLHRYTLLDGTRGYCLWREPRLHLWLQGKDWSTFLMLSQVNVHRTQTINYSRVEIHESKYRTKKSIIENQRRSQTKFVSCIWPVNSGSPQLHLSCQF